MEAMETDRSRPRQVRYQAALRPDSGDLSSLLRNSAACSFSSFAAFRRRNAAQYAIDESGLVGRSCGRSFQE